MTSFYTSLNGLKNSQTDLSTIAHNIANAETTGFKKSSVEFADLVANAAWMIGAAVITAILGWQLLVRLRRIRSRQTPQA